MTTNLLANTETGGLPRHDELAQQLDRAFGATFRYWVPGEDQWRPEDDSWEAPDSATGKVEMVVAAAAISRNRSRSYVQ